MGNEISMGAEVWGRNKVDGEWGEWEGPHRYIGPMRSHGEYDPIGVYVTNSTTDYFKEITTTDPREEKRPESPVKLEDDEEFLPLMDNQGTEVMRFGTMEIQDLTPALRNGFRAFVLEDGNDKARKTGLAHMWTDLNTHQLYTISFNDSSIKAKILGVIMKATK